MKIKKRLLIILLIVVLNSCKTTETTGSDYFQINENISYLKTNKGFVFGSNIKEHNFIIFLPGKEISIELVGFNIMITLDKQVYQVITKSIPRDIFSEYTKSDILLSLRNLQMEEMENELNTKFLPLKNSILTNERNNDTVHIWGYEYEKEIIKTESLPESQLYIEMIKNKPIILCINAPSENSYKNPTIQENMIKIIANAEFYDTTINNKKLIDFYNKYKSRY